MNDQATLRSPRSGAELSGRAPNGDQVLPDRIAVPEDLLTIRRLQQLGVELTTSCNLACVYCHFAPLSRRGNDVGPDLVENIVDFVRSFPVDHVTMSGDAEITMYKGWHKVADRLLELGVNLRTISNFSKGVFSDEEIEAFSQFSEILISLDTADAAKLKKIRYRADLRTMTCNMPLIRARAIERSRPMPHFVCNVVVHDKNATEVDRTAAFAVANGFGQMNLVRYVEVDEVVGGKNDFQDNPNAIPVYPASTLSQYEAAMAIKAIQRAADICEGRMHLNILPDVVDELRAVLLPEDMAAKKEAMVPAGRTRTKACRMPWDFLYVTWNGDIPPCCIVKDAHAASAANRPLTDVVNGDEFKELRRSLLSGELNDVCRKCTYVPDTDTENLQVQIRQYLDSQDAHLAEHPAAS